ncbi:hypothetical protein [Nioella sp. MMSF_3534]|uniref:hypothetical protein n=1 Tax=Nioella sp. MMSF_3534 TaxID=3046720 RepID=UPI00273DF592|nr:hypothetical protein [Nioella sp. MMSF_3534]
MGIARCIQIEAFLPTEKALTAARIAERLSEDLALAQVHTAPHPEGGHIARFTSAISGESWAEDVLIALTLAGRFGRDIRVNGRASEALTIAVIAPTVVGVESVTLDLAREGEPE